MTTTLVAPEQERPIRGDDAGTAPAPARAGRVRRACGPAVGWVPRRVARRVAGAAHDAGMATAEYAIATLAAVGFAGLLVVILKGNEVKGLLLNIVKQALSL
ncbi:DUF4244 domain-containing protein [Cellulomonas sp. DKR-3]|uniref:DUF4244 domain-containing protein n=1 Tax=Cellulomonas fulva TaxID=2835530 RepID=A0ABS5TYD9_9CELL|nr:DUF4244 domain-containing protein [Cellulomonas fulva]MBT0994153.1 DUF4244 domain-containing protein [Cellulomonas fulva]